MNITLTSSHPPGARPQRGFVMPTPLAFGLAIVGVGLSVTAMVTRFPLAYAGTLFVFAGGIALVSSRGPSRKLAVPRDWVITADGLRYGNELGETRWDWAAVRSVVKKRDVYLLYQAGAELPFDVPRAPLTADEEREFRSFLQARGLL